ncbi:MAG: NAD(P)H-hydrate dehydratase [Pseudomonadota bacterium]|nr:NAD(P)H-hydrate dehydratase [Pseudomonadota bacterium]
MDHTEQKSFSDNGKPRLADLAECQGWLPVRSENSHKGSNGRVLIAGGEQAMAGAACLAGWSAYISGAGLVRVACIPENITAISANRPELLVSGIQSTQQLKKLFRQSDVLALGPGLGQSSWSRTIFEYCLEFGHPDIIDADGLNLLAKSPARRQNWILTPHPAEAGRLLKCKTSDVQSDRIYAVKEIVKQYGGICILKGNNTLIAVNEKNLWLCPYGNAVLAVAGTGDVLTGLLAGFLAQGVPLEKAAVAAVVLHASAGDLHASEHGAIGMLASDLMQPLRRLRNGCNPVR